MRAGGVTIHNHDPPPLSFIAPPCSLMSQGHLLLFLLPCHTKEISSRQNGS
jgi:hypothetical protein